MATFPPLSRRHGECSSSFGWIMRDAPLIDPNYLGDADGLMSPWLWPQLDIPIRLANQVPTLSDHILSATRTLSSRGKRWTSYAMSKESMRSGSHFMGTAKMGPNGTIRIGSGSVVDTSFRVKGVKNLRMCRLERISAADELPSCERCVSSRGLGCREAYR